MSQSKVVNISVIVPVLHEAGNICALAEHVHWRALADGVGVQLVVVDGDPRGSSLAALDSLGETELSRTLLLTSEPGRAIQMNAGAQAASGDVLLFLHADTRLPRGSFRRILEVMNAGFAQAGAFDLQYDARGTVFDFLAATARLRSRLERCPYGDQAHFFPRAVFFGLGGYPNIPIMEDVELMWRVRRRKLPLCILPDRVITSARRYLHEGLIRRVVRNFCLRVAHALGVAPAKLLRWYQPPFEEKA